MDMPTTPRPGDVLVQGRICLETPLGEGGMGSVWRARVQGIEGTVAVKLARPELACRLRDEARAASRVRHPHLLAVLETGDDPRFGPFVVSELLDGGSLQERLLAGPLPWPQVEAEVAGPLLEALAVLHDAGVLHRDVKPENVLFDRSGRLVLADLGLALFEGRDARTVEGAVVGSPGFMAPECLTVASEELGTTADVYGAAMVLVVAAAGRLPFRATVPVELVREQATRRVGAGELVRMGVPASVAPLLAAAIDMDPGRRPDDCRRLLEQLRAPKATPPAPVPTVRVPRGASVPSCPHVPERGTRARRAALPCLVLLLAVLGGGWSLFFRGGDGGSSAMELSEPIVEELVGAAPLVPDSTAQDLIARLWRGHAGMRRDEPGAEGQLQALAQSVGRGTGTTSPVFVAVADFVEVARWGQAHRALYRCEALAASLERYLDEPVVRGGDEGLVFASWLLRRIVVAADASGSRQGRRVAEEAMASSYRILAEGSRRLRERRGAATLEAVLETLQTTHGDGPLATGEGGWGLGELRAAIVGTLRLRLRHPRAYGYACVPLSSLPVSGDDPTTAPLRIETWADLARREYMPVVSAFGSLRRGLEELRYDRVDGSVANRAGSPPVDEIGDRRMVAEVIAAWYRLSLSTVQEPVTPGDAEARWVWCRLSHQILARGLGKVFSDIVRPLTMGPFRRGLLARRLLLFARRLADEAAEGDATSAGILHAEIDDVLDAVFRSFPHAWQSMVEAFQEGLGSAELLVPTRVAVDAWSLLARGDEAGARLQTREAVFRALELVERAGSHPGMGRVTTLARSLERFRKAVDRRDEPDARRDLRAVAERCAGLVDEVEAAAADGDLPASLATSYRIEVDKARSARP